MGGFALSWEGMLAALLLWIAAVALAIVVLTLLFPRLQRRDPGEGERGPLPPVPAGAPELPLRRQTQQPLLIVETREVAHMPAERRARYWRGNLRLIGGLLVIWFACSYVPAILAPWLNRIEILGGFPLGYYMGAQGAPLVFLALTAIYTWVMTRRDLQYGARAEGPGEQKSFLPRYGGIALALLVAALGVVLLEVLFPLSATEQGWILIGLTIVAYGVIGVRNRTTSLDEYYVAGRRVPALFNGLAVSADWMSAATFISLAGTLWLLGYEGLAYIIGWTGGYVLLALFLAPYIRKFGQYTVPDFIGARYGGTFARLTAAVMAILVSFTYLTAQVSGVGIIMGRFLGVRYILGVAIGLGAVLFCSYLGGMKAVTWTQVLQGALILLTYLVPVTYLALRVTGVPFPQLMYGAAFEPIARLEELQGIERAYAEPFNDWSVWNFLALITCLMVGTAGLPHILIRFYTAPSVVQARRSVSWGLLFIILIYLAIPAYAAFSRWEILQHVVGQPVRALPQWAVNWGNVGLLHITDLTTLSGQPADALPAWAQALVSRGELTVVDSNGDGVVQPGELHGPAVTADATDGVLQYHELQISPDLIVPSTPEIVGLPDTVAALVAAGGLAAALSTADGLLMVITSAVAHDIYFRVLNRSADTRTRLAVGRLALLCAATLAGLTALRQLGIIVELVAWAFSLAAATIFPALALGIFWRRANQAGAVAGMLCGLVVTVAYIIANRLNPEFNLLGISSPAAGIFGLPVNFLVAIVVSRLTPPPPPETQIIVDALRRP
ncbi:MAG: VC_2705 family sodium/solute symporter [Chloroflexota bacterium]